MEKLVGRVPPPARKGLREWYDAYTYHGHLRKNNCDYKTSTKSLYEACLRAKDKCWETEWFLRHYVPDMEFVEDSKRWIDNDEGTGLGYFLVYFYDRQIFEEFRISNGQEMDLLRKATTLGYGPAMSWMGTYRRGPDAVNNACDFLVRAWEWGDRDALREAPDAIRYLTKGLSAGAFSDHVEWMRACNRVASDLGCPEAARFLRHFIPAHADPVEVAHLSVKVIRNQSHNIDFMDGIEDAIAGPYIFSPIQALSMELMFKNPLPASCIPSLFVYGEYFDSNSVKFSEDCLGKNRRSVIKRACGVFRMCCDGAREAAVEWCIISRKIPSMNRDIRKCIATLIWKDRSTWPTLVQREKTDSAKRRKKQ